MLANYVPRIRGTDEAIWRRCLILRWSTTISAQERDRYLAHKLESEASGILNHLVDGLIDWRNNGLVIPEAMITSIAASRDKTDQLGQFLAEYTKPEIGSQIQSSKLYRVYVRMSRRLGITAMSITRFGREMRRRGMQSRRSSVILWLDTALNVSDMNLLSE
jgi:putative DNA primase/helicase